MAEANWISVDTDSFDKELAAKYAALKKAQAEVAKTKEAFETAFVAKAVANKNLDAGDSLAFGYRFGKLAVAKVEVTKKEPKKPMFRF
jgi:hypothetical protein